MPRKVGSTRQLAHLSLRMGACENAPRCAERVERLPEIHELVCWRPGPEGQGRARPPEVQDEVMFPTTWEACAPLRTENLSYVEKQVLMVLIKGENISYVAEHRAAPANGYQYSGGR